MLHKAEGLQELIDVDVAILIEVDAPGKVTDAVICDVDVHMRAEELPCLSELIQGDEPLPEGRSHFSESIKFSVFISSDILARTPAPLLLIQDTHGLVSSLNSQGDHRKPLHQEGFPPPPLRTFGNVWRHILLSRPR